MKHFQGVLIRALEAQKTGGPSSLCKPVGENVPKEGQEENTSEMLQILDACGPLPDEFPITVLFPRSIKQQLTQTKLDLDYGMAQEMCRLLTHRLPQSNLSFHLQSVIYVRFQI